MGRRLDNALLANCHDARTSHRPSCQGHGADRGLRRAGTGDGKGRGPHGEAAGARPDPGRPSRPGPPSAADRCPDRQERTGRAAGGRGERRTRPRHSSPRPSPACVAAHAAEFTPYRDRIASWVTGGSSAATSSVRPTRVLPRRRGGRPSPCGGPGGNRGSCNLPGRHRHDAIPRPPRGGPGRGPSASTRTSSARQGGDGDRAAARLPEAVSSPSGPSWISSGTGGSARRSGSGPMRRRDRPRSSGRPDESFRDHARGPRISEIGSRISSTGKMNATAAESGQDR